MFMEWCKIKKIVREMGIVPLRMHFDVGSLFLLCIYELEIFTEANAPQISRDLQEEKRKRAEIDAQVKVYPRSKFSMLLID